jgi:hypothetical protein
MKNTLLRIFQHTLLFFILIFSASNGQCNDNGPLKSDSVHIMVDMSFMVSSGVFHPLTDTVEMEGSMIDSAKIMEFTGAGYVYKLSFYLPVDGLYTYKFRINAKDSIDTVYYETADPSTRTFRVKDTTQTIMNFYSNYHPGWIPMIFDCDMYYQIKAAKFSPALDYLDVSGNFNNWGAERIELFPSITDSIYSFTLYYDSTALPAEPFRFKFRFNGDTATMELQGDSNRVFTMTTTDHHFFCWYDNLDPNVPAVPFVYDVVINESTVEDSLVSRRIYTGAYRYEDYNLKLEGKSLYQWYSADSIGGMLTPIDSAWNINYIIIDSLKTDSVKNDLFGKYLVFEVTPVTIDSVTGLPGYAWSSTRIFPVGMREPEPPSARIYPNPVDEVLNIEFLKPVKSMELTDMMGKRILYQDILISEIIRLNLGSLERGIYFLKLSGNLNSVKVYKVIKK